ncbi:serine/threonine-protein kinase Sgk1-like isoform X5 [Amblyomma americanum]
MLICADVPIPTLHALAPGLLFTCHVPHRSSKVRPGTPNGSLRHGAAVPPSSSRPNAVAGQPRTAAERAPSRPGTSSRAPERPAQAAASQVSGLSVVTTSQDSAPRTPRSDAEQLLQAPAAQPGATTPFRDTTEADGERTPKQPTSCVVSPSGAPVSPGSKAGSPMRRNSPPGHAASSAHSPVQPTSPPEDPAAVRGGQDPDDSQISLGDVDDVTFWVNPDEASDWRLSSLQQLQVLGKGSFGVVYLVRHKATKELAALKCIEKHHREQAKEARRVEAERMAWQAVSHHPFVATLKAYYETTKAWCFVMEYVPRGTLSQIIRRSGPLPESKAKLVSAQLAHALNFVHTAGYLHRDISSSNVLLDERGNARLIDFGLCQLGLEARNRCGSLAYMAPEVLRREHYGVGADWWSFGIVLYTMLIGKTPLSQYAAEQNINIQTTRRELRYSMALAAPLRFPRSLTDEAYNILQEILREDPSMRLGCRTSGGPGNSGFQEMMQHKFFSTVDWRAMIGDVRQVGRSGSRNPRDEAAPSGGKASSAGASSRQLK